MKCKKKIEKKYNFFPKPKMMSFVHIPNIFSLQLKQRNQKIFTFKKLESENCVLSRIYK